MELYACNGDLKNRPELDKQPVSTVQIWALVNLSKQRRTGGGGKRREF